MSHIIINKLFHSVFWEMMGLEQYTHSSSLPDSSRLFSELLMSCTWLHDVCLPMSGYTLGNCMGWRDGKEERDMHLQRCVTWWLPSVRPLGSEGPGAALLQALNASSLLFLSLCHWNQSVAYIWWHSRKKKACWCSIHFCLAQVWARREIKKKKKRNEC